VNFLAVPVMALAAAQSPPSGLDVVFAAPPAIEAWAHEDWPIASLEALRKLPRVSLAVVTRSNMLRTELFASVRRSPTLVKIAPKLEPAHVEAYRKLSRATLVVPVPDTPDAALATRLSSLGRQPIRFLVGRLGERQASFLSGFKGGEVELDVRDRIPENEELTRLLGLTRLRRMVRLRASQPPDMVAGLLFVKPTRFVVESVEDRVPATMVDALARTGVEVRVSVDGDVGLEDLRRMSRIDRLSLELHLEREQDGVPRRVREFITALSPRYLQ
jgi:hypothetical protein